MKKGLVTLVCLTVMSAVMSWAATFYVQTKTTTAGGTITVGTVGAVGAVTNDGGINVIKYAPVNATIVNSPVASRTPDATVITTATVAPKTNYKLVSVTKNGVPVDVTNNPNGITFDLTAGDFRSTSTATGFKNPAIVASFADTTAPAAGALKSWQLQVRNNNVGGTITTTRNADAAVSNYPVGQLVLKNYKDTAPVHVAVTLADGYDIDKVTLNGVVKSASFDVDPSAAGKVFTVLATYKKKVYNVTTNTLDPVAFPNGIIPVNPKQIAYDGTLKLSVIPSGTYNVTKAIAVTGVVAPTVKYYDAYGKELAANPFPIKGGITMVISNIKSNLTVTPTYGRDTTAEMANCTSTCHLQSGVSQATVDVNTTWGNSNHKTKGAVDCVSCHKSMPGPAYDTIEAKAALCDSCHNNNSAAFITSIHWTSETGHESDADFIAAGHGSVASCAAKCHFNQGASKGCAVCHSNALQTGGVIVAGNDMNHDPKVATVDNTCYVCHTGNKHGWSPRAFEKSTHFTGEHAKLYYNFDKVKCLGCHDPHSTEATFGDNVSTGCAKCHKGTYGIAGKAPHYGGAYEATATGTAKTQFVTQGAVCADCHAHDNTINAGYAESGHGKVSQDAMNAFNHYDWSARLNNGTRQNGNCDRCHTSGGFIKFLGNDTATATRLNPVTGQAQGVLVCTTCHKYLEGEGHEKADLRADAVPAGNPTALTGGYFALFSSAAANVTAGNTKIEVAFPGYKNSSICIPCHSGRTTDRVITATIDQSKLAAKNYSTISTGFYQHAANMGQTFIGKGAWDYQTNPRAAVVNSHADVKNGTSDTQGPCVGCHYNTPGKTHSLEVANFAVCATCHRAGFGAADVTLAEEKFEAGVKVLTALIKEKFEPLRVNQALPIETERANVRFGRFGKAAGVAADAETAKKAYGAWYNWHILTNADKAAFVHNPAYARQILFDTIDYLDGNGAALNGSAEATIAASAALTTEEKELAEAYAVPACGSCHAEKAAAAQEGKHAAETNTHNGSCGRCHSTEGYLAFTAEIAAGSGNVFTGNYTTSYNGATGVSCAVCHESHKDGVVLRSVPNFDPKVNGVSGTAEYKLCTSCHNLTDGNGALVGPAMQQHGKDWYRNIASTHYDNPATGTVTNVGTVIEGYVVRANKASACTDCHGHDFYTNTGKALDVPSATDAEKGKQTIHTEWASSGHAGKLLTLKWANYTTTGANKRQRNTTTYAAIAAIGVTPASGAAWEHYNWDADDRAGCQHCHTATGAANYISGNRTAKNDFSHLQGWTTTGSAQNEVLYCWGCHKDAGTGELLSTEAIELDYKANAADTAKVVLPKVGDGKSTACFSCHAGRGNAASLFTTATIDPNAALTTTSTPKSTASATSTHYANAAATIFKNETKVGYEFPGLNYANPSYFAHNKVGCNECHMANKNHKFEVVEKDANGAISKLVATNCVTCHSGAHGTKLEAGVPAAAAFIEEEAEGYKQALAAFNDALIAQGYTWTPTHPYFTFTGPQAAAKWRKQGDLGAGHNYNYLLHEAGAYAHNRLYAKRLIYDSMDWLDNNIMDGSVAIDAKYPEAQIWLGTARP